MKKYDNKGELESEIDALITCLKHSHNVSDSKEFCDWILDEQLIYKAKYGEFYKPKDLYT